jgi:hypothetical protein
MRHLLFMVFLSLTPGAIQAERSVRERSPVFLAEVTAFDISDDGLTYRLVGDIPSQSDPLGKFLRSTAQDWTVAVGFADIKDAVDTGTQRLSAKGGHAWFANFGRQWEWRLPQALSINGWMPAVQAETGVHYATASIPAGGTHFQFLVSTGFEWLRSLPTSESDWIIGVRWLHYSNANIFTSNAGYDSLVVRVGRFWKW